jgi:hypothetical protein
MILTVVHHPLGKGIPPRGSIEGGIGDRVHRGGETLNGGILKYSTNNKKPDEREFIGF